MPARPALSIGITEEDDLMAGKPVGADVLNQLDALFHAGVIGDLSDADLLHRFLGDREGSDRAALAALVERHGPMVLRVCRQTLGNSHDAMDAFQATFLVLARKAGSVRKADSLASWLHGVAYRVARRARADAARRRAREQPGALLELESPGGAAPPETFPELHEEIARLPRRYRDPVVLCYLEGMTTEAAARRLGWPRGTVLSRLSRARDQLRGRLTRRGLAPSESAMMVGVAPGALRASLPSALLNATVQAGLGFVQKGPISTTLASATAVGLARGVLLTMTISQVKVVGVSALACAFVLGGARGLAYQIGGIGGGAAPKPAEPDDPRAALIRSVEKLQTQLDEANRLNAALRKELDEIRAKADSLVADPPRAEVRKLEAENKTANVKGGNPRTFQRIGDFIVATSTFGDKITFLNLKTKTASSMRIGGTKESPIQIVPIVGPGAVALWLKGANITRIAACDALDGVWRLQELREPILNGEASPTVGAGVVAYPIGRYVYAYSPSASRWDVLELPEGTRATPLVGTTSVTIEGDGYTYVFDAKIGKWDFTDYRALIDAAEKAVSGDPEPKK